MTNQSSRAVRGILGEKLGMTQVFDANNRIVPVTVVKAGPCVVTQIRTQERDGYTAVQLAYGQIDPRKVTKPLSGHFQAAGVTPRRHVIELRTSSTEGYEVGQEFGADVFADGASVDVTGTTKGKGTAGVMKRHGFHGVSASHGSHRNHRKPGSIGGCSRACGWQAGWVSTSRPPRACGWSGSTPSVACCSSRAQCPAPRAAWCWSVPQ
jgi:large subunit ribosomal protein L3